jgi:hypothetical protein
MTIGVGVEGPSDFRFWHKVLHKHFRGIKFDVRNMKNREKLIRLTPDLFETFQSAHYSAGFILIDRDNTPSACDVMLEFETLMQAEARKPATDRFLFLCVAIKELEAWYLADDAAIRQLLPTAQYTSPNDTASLNALSLLTRFWQNQFGGAALSKISLAEQFGSKFDPLRAAQHSASFSHFWNHVAAVCQR